MSGSRGEANFVWRCKSCKVCASAPLMMKDGTVMLTSVPERIVRQYQEPSESLPAQLPADKAEYHRV